MTERPRIHRQHSTSIDAALRDPALLGAALGDWRSWTTWLAVLRAAFGLALTAEELETFAAVAGGRNPPTERVREFWAIVGRRGGKSKVAAAVAVFLALFVRHRLSPGEHGVVLVLAASQNQAKVALNYVRAFLLQSPVLAQEVDSVTAWEIRLRNGITVSIHSNSFRTIRGRTLCACVFDECALWRSEDSANPDSETYSAVLPGLLTTRGMLIGISTGYRRAGLLYQKHRDHFGVDTPDILIVQGSTVQFNLELTEADIAAQRAADPASAAAEWDGTFRDDVASFLDDELIEAAIEPGRPMELPPRHGIFYRAFTDASGGVGADSYTLSIGHKAGQNFVIDLVRGTSGRFDPGEVTKQYAALLKQYHIGSVGGDHFAAEWVVSAWRSCNVAYSHSPLPKSAIYLETAPLFARGLVRLPDHPRLLRELRLLERHTHRSGKDSIDHGRGGHDDHANAVCGVLRTLSSHLGFDNTYRAWNEGDVEDEPAANARLRARYAAYVASAGRLL